MPRKTNGKVGYAVNVCDLTNKPFDNFMTQLLLGPVTEGRIIIECEPDRLDGAALVLECDQKRAEAIIHILRIKQPCPNKMRCYSYTGIKAKKDNAMYYQATDPKRVDDPTTAPGWLDSING